MIDIYRSMPVKIDESDSNSTINSKNGNMNVPYVWNKVVKTIQSSNIDINKLIKDSINYGLNVGLFQQSKSGKIVPHEALDKNNITNNAKRLVKGNKKTVNATIRSTKLNSIFKYKQRKFSRPKLTIPSSIKTRKSINIGDFKETSNLYLNMKRRRTKNTIVSVNESINKEKISKIKCIRREMVRPVPICAYCLGDEAMNKRTKVREDMIACWDCGTCAHPTCLRWPSNLIDKVRTVRWQCLQCKCCSYCGNVSRKDDNMLLCDACDRGFHMLCFDPPMKSLPKGEWICNLCKCIGDNKENLTSFSSEDFNFTPDCQIVTVENVKDLCSPKHKQRPIPNKRSKIGQLNGKSHSKISLLQQKKKKLLKRAVLRQRSALTDGLTMFFTPGNKRTSRVSKQSLTSNSLNDLNDHLPPTSAEKIRTPILSRSLSRSSVTPDRRRHSKASMKEDISISENYRPNTSSNADLDEQNNSNSKEFSPVLAQETVKKRGRKRKILKESDLSLMYGKSRTKLSCGSSSLAEAIRIIKKRGRKKKVITDLKADNVAEASVTESSSLTISRIDQSTSQSIMSTENTDVDPYPISDLDRQWYADIQEKVAQLLPPSMDAPLILPPHLAPLSKKSRKAPEHSEPPELCAEGGGVNDSFCSNMTGAGDVGRGANIHKRYPPRIQIGKYVVDTWYSAPYPSEYARLNVLYICEYCLKHIKSYDIYVMHMEKCNQHFPPGNEIYRNGDLSVFEVDGYVSKLYCQQLCLLAKLFLDHKTLYYDVEPFLFYVAVISKNDSCHIIGYFSKEKRSTHKYNLSCIMVLPQYQKYNYGRFLIDFSYLLSRYEGQSGSPEKPLSTLGRLSYESYWKSKIIPFLLNTEEVTGEFYRQSSFSKPPSGLSVTIDRISTDTGINPHDVASTIQLLSKTVDLDDGDRITIQLDWDKVRSESEKYANRYLNWVPLDAECLRWAPLMQPNEKIHQSANQLSNVSGDLYNMSIHEDKLPEIEDSESIQVGKVSNSKKSPEPLDHESVRPSMESVISSGQNVMVCQEMEVDLNDSPPKLKPFSNRSRKIRRLTNSVKPKFDSNTNVETSRDYPMLVQSPEIVDGSTASIGRSTETIRSESDPDKNMMLTGSEARCYTSPEIIDKGMVSRVRRIRRSTETVVHEINTDKNSEASGNVTAHNLSPESIDKGAVSRVRRLRRSAESGKSQSESDISLKVTGKDRVHGDTLNAEINSMTKNVPSTVKTRKRSESMERKSERDSMASLIVKEDLLKEPEVVIDRMNTDILSTVPSNMTNACNDKEPLDSRSVQTRRLSSRHLPRANLASDTRSRNATELSEILLTDDINIRNIPAPKIPTSVPPPDSKSLSINKASTERKLKPFDKNIEKRRRKPKKSVDLETDSVKSLWWVNVPEKPSTSLVPPLTATQRISLAPSVVINIAPIHVDLTSDNSDNQDNDDCVVIPPPIPRRQNEWRKSKPVLEMLRGRSLLWGDDWSDERITESMISREEHGMCRPSPSSLLTEPSPASHTVGITCPTIASAETDDEPDTDLIPPHKRQPLIILEKCDVRTDRNAQRDADLLVGREITITVSGSTSHTYSPDIVPCDESVCVSDMIDLCEGVDDESVSDGTCQVCGHWSCDSSMCAQVSSTTMPPHRLHWQSPMKHLETLCVLVQPLTPIVALPLLDNPVDFVRERDEEDVYRSGAPPGCLECRDIEPVSSTAALEVCDIISVSDDASMAGTV